MKKIKSSNILLGVSVLIIFSYLFLFNLTNKDMAFAQTCQDHKVICDGGGSLVVKSLSLTVKMANQNVVRKKMMVV